MSEWLKRQNLLLRTPDNLYYYQQYKNMLHCKENKEYYVFRIVKNYTDIGFKGMKTFLKRRKVFK